MQNGRASRLKTARASGAGQLMQAEDESGVLCVVSLGASVARLSRASAQCRATAGGGGAHSGRPPCSPCCLSAHAGRQAGGL